MECESRINKQVRFINFPIGLNLNKRGVVPLPASHLLHSGQDGLVLIVWEVGQLIFILEKATKDKHQYQKVAHRLTLRLICHASAEGRWWSRN